MFQSTSSGTELLLANNDLRSLLRPRRSNKTPLIVGAAIFILLLIAVSIGLASRSRHPNASEHPVMARLAAADLWFNTSAPSSNSSGPALVDFSIHGGKDDDYGELDKI